MRLRDRSKMPTECSDMNNCEEAEVPNFDTKKFISEMEQRPAIWDTTIRLYSDKQAKKECWDELVDIFIGKENPSEEERSDFCRTLQRKWKSARDCFNRECQRLKMANQGIATSRKSPYVFYKNLSFLHKVMSKNKSLNGAKNRESTSTLNDTSNSNDASYNATDTLSISITGNLSPNCAADTSSSTEHLNVNDIYPIDEEEDDNDDEDLTPGPSLQRRPKRRKIEIDLDEDSQLTRMLQPNIQLIEGKAQTTESAPKTLEDDSDRLFLLSLLEPLRQVPERLKMTVRVRMMQVVDSAMKFGRDMAQE